MNVHWDGPVTTHGDKQEVSLRLKSLLQDTRPGMSSNTHCTAVDSSFKSFCKFFHTDGAQ